MTPGVIQMLSEIKKYRTALEFYSKIENWCEFKDGMTLLNAGPESAAAKDKGKKARIALGIEKDV